MSNNGKIQEDGSLREKIVLHRAEMLEKYIDASGMGPQLEAAKLQAWTGNEQVTLRQFLLGSMLTHEQETERLLDQQDVNSWCVGALRRHEAMSRRTEKQETALS